MDATWYWGTSAFKTHLRNSVQHRDYTKNVTETGGTLDTQVWAATKILVTMSAEDHCMAQVWRRYRPSWLPRPSYSTCWVSFPRNHSRKQSSAEYHNLSIQFPLEKKKKKPTIPEIFHTWDINLSVHSCLTVSKKIAEGRYMNFLSTLWDICNTESETSIMCVQKSRWVFQQVKYDPTQFSLSYHTFNS